MSQSLRMDSRVRVANPSKKNAHTKGWVGRLDSPAREAGGWWLVRFMGGRGKYHASELEVID
jgi:hypothetical protein